MDELPEEILKAVNYKRKAVNQKRQKQTIF